MPRAGQARGTGNDREVSSDTDRAHSRTPTAVRDAERLVQIEVADVGAELAGPGVTDERVEVGAVDVDLATRGMHDGAEFSDRRLEHAVRGRVGDHDGRQAIAHRVDLGAHVVEVDVATLVARDHDHLHAGHHGAGGVGAMGTRRDEADRALVIAS